MEDIPYGVCGTRGACGAGCAISLVTRASFMSDRTRSVALKATSHALNTLANMRGSRCCKQSVYVAIKSAYDILEHELSWKVINPQISCDFSVNIPDCKKEMCPYYQ